MNARVPLIRLLLPLLLLTVSASAAFAKDADAYFHGGAYKYVAGKHQDARIEVQEGLRHYPDDARLQRLAKQLDKMDKQQKDPSGQGDKDKDKKDKDKKDKNEPDPKKDGDKKDDEKKKDEKKPAEEKDGKNEDDKPGKNPAGAPPPGQMSEEEAKRLLNSFADDEKKEQRERQKLLQRRMETEQDW
jgi:single-stranded DNA-binding protein